MAYRLNILGDGGRTVETMTIVAGDDAQAIRAAARLFDGRPMELWDNGRLVRRFAVVGSHS